MARIVSIRRSLLENLLVVILLLSSAILATTFFVSRTVTERLSHMLMSQTLDRIDTHLDSFFGPVQGQLLEARAWGAEGLINLDDPEALNALLEPIIHQHRHLSSIIVADTTGREHMLLREDDRWRCRRLDPELATDNAHWREWSDQDQTSTDRRETLDYDPRTRPWYELANPHDDATVRWTEPYEFFTVQEPGITAAISYTDPSGTRYVIAADVLLTDITELTQSIRVGEHGKAMVFTERFLLIGLPRDETTDSAEEISNTLLQDPARLDMPLARDAMSAFQDESIDLQSPNRFRSGRQRWWMQTRPYPLSDQRVLQVAALVPEADLIGGNVTHIRISIGVVTLIILAAAVTRAIILANRYATPVRALVRQSDRISRLDLDRVEHVESVIHEVRQLARAHDRMRESLESLLKLERDLQLARQIQQNTLPLKLPTLPGFELAAMTEPAEETGGDSYDVIGLRRSEDGKLPILTDEEAPEAAFLLADATGHGIGPALSVSQIRAMLRISLRLGAHPGHFVQEMNEQLYADLPEGRFITAFIGYLVAEKRELFCFSAGQAPLLHFVAATGEMNVLHADSMPLGIVPDLEIQDPAPLLLQPGDIFAVLSDGFFEAMNPDDQQFGQARIIDLITREHDRHAWDILESVEQATAGFCAGRPPADDCTAIFIKCTGP